MLWFLISGVLLLVAGIILFEFWDDLGATLSSIGLILMVCSLLSLAFVKLLATTTNYQVVYENDEITVVDESIYTLKITERVSYDFFTKGIKEYELYKNTDRVKHSKKLDDIKSYFSSEIVSVIKE